MGNPTPQRAQRGSVSRVDATEPTGRSGWWASPCDTCLPPLRVIPPESDHRAATFNFCIVYVRLHSRQSGTPVRFPVDVGGVMRLLALLALSVSCARR